MRVFCPNVTIAAETRAALDASGYDWEPLDTSGSDHAYFDVLAGLWSAGETFTLVEHDVIPTPAALASLVACDRDWCAAPYPYLTGTYAGLGCTRFRAPLLARHPGLWDVVATMSDAGHPPQHWCRLDAWSSLTLTRRGETKCTAHPEAGHLSQSPGHGCVPGYPPRT